MKSAATSEQFRGHSKPEVYIVFYSDSYGYPI